MFVSYQEYLCMSGNYTIGWNLTLWNLAPCQQLVTLYRWKQTPYDSTQFDFIK